MYLEKVAITFTGRPKYTEDGQPLLTGKRYEWRHIWQLFAPPELSYTIGAMISEVLDAMDFKLGITLQILAGAAAPGRGESIRFEVRTDFCPEGVSEHDSMLTHLSMLNGEIDRMFKVQHGEDIQLKWRGPMEDLPWFSQSV